MKTVSRKTPKTLWRLSLLLTALASTTVSAAEPKTHMLPVENVEIEGTISMTKEALLSLLPSLAEEGATRSVDPMRLSHEIEFLNDAGAVDVKADFQKKASGTYDVRLTVEEKKNEQFSLSVNNTGNNYTGDWRLGLNYLNRNLSGQSDTLGIATASSPGHWSDVKQGALVYRTLLPKTSDAMYFSVSHSDVDLGTLGTVGGIGIAATGKGTMAGLHYQKSLTYSRTKKQILDFGIDHKNYDNSTNYTHRGTTLLNNTTDYNVTTASVSYVDTTRTNNRSLSYSLGYTHNFSNGDGFEKNRTGADAHYNLFTASLNYQYRTPSDYLIVARLHGQYTKDDIVSTEQLGAGGMHSVRGFKERIASADKGIVGSLEFYTPEFAKNQRALLFLDAARLQNNHAAYGEIHREGIASWGIGYRLFESNGLSVRLDWADAFRDLGGKNAQNAHRPWHLSITQSF